MYAYACVCVGITGLESSDAIVMMMMMMIVVAHVYTSNKSRDGDRLSFCAERAFSTSVF